MTAVPFSYRQYGGNGSNRDFAVPFPFLVRAHVSVYLGLDLATGIYSAKLVDGTDYTWTNDTSIRTTTAPATGVTLSVVRLTPVDELAVQWQDGSALVAEDLLTSDKQNLYVVQENTDLGVANGVVSQAALTTAGTALTNATAAQAAAAAAQATANTASTNANTAISTANTASSNASSAVSTASTASTNASAAVSTANTASTNANTAISTANAATTTANNALTYATAANTKSDTAIAAVAAAVVFTPVANVAAIPAAPANNTYISITDSTGLESFTPLSGIPAGFTGDAGLTARLVYKTASTSWLWVDYYANNADSRYLKLSGGGMTGPLLLSGAPTAALNPTTKAYVDSADSTLASAAAAAQSTANTAVSNAAAAQSSANTGIANAATAQSTANTGVANAATAQATANAALPKAGGTMTGAIVFAGTQATATTTAAGIVQLVDSTASSSTSTAATPNSVKAAADLASAAGTVAGAALPKAGGTMTGNITFASAQPLGDLRFTQAGTGAVARAVDARLKDVVSVKDFGAAGNGVADDTDAISAALGALVTRGGGTLFFPTGTYLINAGIPLVGKVHYKGEGREASIIRQTSWDAVIGMGYRTGIAEDPGLMATGLFTDATIPAKVKQSAKTRLGLATEPSLNYWKISDLTLDGGANPANQIHKDDAFGNVIRTELHAYGEISSCNIINSWNQGISLYFYSNNIIVSNCTFKNIGQPGGTPVGYLASRYYTGNGIFVEFSAYKTIITDNLFESMNQRCVWYTCAGERGDDSQKDHIFSNNTCYYGGSTSAIEAIYSGTYSSGFGRVAGIHGLQITGNRLICSTQTSEVAAIYFANATSVQVSNNYIYNSLWGLWYTNSRGVVSDNIFHTCANAAIRTSDSTTTLFRPVFTKNILINTPLLFYTGATQAFDTAKSSLVFGNNAYNARMVAAAGGTVVFSLPQGNLSFSAQRFPYKCQVTLTRNGGAYNHVQGEFTIGRGFIGGGGFRDTWGITSRTWVIDPDSLNTNFVFSFNTSTFALTITNNDATFNYQVALLIDYSDVQSLG